MNIIDGMTARTSRKVCKLNNRETNGICESVEFYFFRMFILIRRFPLRPGHLNNLVHENCKRQALVVGRAAKTGGPSYG